MQLILSEPVLQDLSERLAENGMLKLVYDTDGCGCAVNGVPAIWLVDHPSADDQSITSNAPFQVLIHRNQDVFFEELMMLDRNASGYFRLASHQQIYSTHVACYDKRGLQSQEV
ncbi:iron-sulfur cluster biosynthesis family protein [Paenibacillus sp. 1001270B_150601_E10]|uniref:iron-sulfur cluster biosynthesis family protein n=1 Tax=Paenibacillus sp. 1001270B_150601_E10 TaxID=2787079 RepID=UPI0018A0B7BE|nr:iron-sulfur cluster biosynthesis family protein [Paenibacillus sp. 1001270B_150601_E10]